MIPAAPLDCPGAKPAASPERNVGVLVFHTELPAPLSDGCSLQSILVYISKALMRMMAAPHSPQVLQHACHER